jgi:hypothetical protein
VQYAIRLPRFVRISVSPSSTPLLPDRASATRPSQFLQDNSKATNTRVLPQLFVDGKYLGDYAVLEELVEAGELKALVV